MPTPNSTASSASGFGADGVLSSSSASTITQVSYADAESRPSERTTPTNPIVDGVDPAITPASTNQAGDDEADDEDPTIRMGHPNGVGYDAAGFHSQYSSYANTDLEDSDSGSDDAEIVVRRDESPAASLRFVDGRWGRKSVIEKVRREEEDEDEDHLTEDEVVYRGSGSAASSFGRSGASVGSKGGE